MKRLSRCSGKGVIDRALVGMITALSLSDRIVDARDDEVSAVHVENPMGVVEQLDMRLGVNSAGRNGAAVVLVVAHAGEDSEPRIERLDRAEGRFEEWQVIAEIAREDDEVGTVLASPLDDVRDACRIHERT